MPKGYPGTKAPHGTLTRYTSHACRCDECRAAMREYRHTKGVRPMEDYLAAIEPAHGTESRYTSPVYKCRCAPCRAAANEAKRRRRQHPNPARHGTVNAYKNGCRCDRCREPFLRWHREYRRAKRKAATA